MHIPMLIPAALLALASLALLRRRGFSGIVYAAGADVTQVMKGMGLDPRIGSGSDHTVFLNHLAVLSLLPALLLFFRRPALLALTLALLALTLDMAPSLTSTSRKQASGQSRAHMVLTSGMGSRYTWRDHALTFPVRLTPQTRILHV